MDHPIKPSYMTIPQKIDEYRMDTYNNKIRETMIKYAGLPFTEKNKCDMLGELRSIVEQAKFDLIPQHMLIFPIGFQVAGHQFLIDVNCDLYVEN